MCPSRPRARRFPALLPPLSVIVRRGPLHAPPYCRQEVRVFSHGAPAHESPVPCRQRRGSVNTSRKEEWTIESTAAGETAAGHHAPIGLGGRGPPDLKMTGRKREIR